MIRLHEILLILIMCVSGCTASFSPNLIPAPGVDKTFRSIDSYLDADGYVTEVIIPISKARTALRPVKAPFSINGSRQTMQPDTRLYDKSVEIEDNIYYIGIDSRVKLEKQKDINSCWASCVQYMTLFRHGKYITQDELIKRLSQKIGESEASLGATIIEIMDELGMLGLTWSQNGATQILESLAAGMPVTIGIINPDGTHHAMIVTGASYCFFDSFIVVDEYPVAFHVLEVLDPATGEKRYIDAAQIENALEFVLSYTIMRKMS